MIVKHIFEEPAVNRSEILRYARIRKETEDTEETSRLIDECIREARPLLSYRICYSRFPIERKDGMICFSLIQTSSQTVSKAFEGCEEMILFAATIGAEFDRLTMRYSRFSPSKAVILQALGAERVESLCDAFCSMMKQQLQNKNRSIKPRVSPGYGDIPLSMQKEIFALLDCERKIGLTLNENLLMSPSKSVTAMMGISDCFSDEKLTCDNCPAIGCAYRKEV